MKKYKIGYTQGTYDLFHIGHLNLLKNAKEQCEYLIVGINTDRLVKEYKNKNVVISEQDRAKIVESIKFVDEIILTDTLDKKDIANKIKFNVIFIGSDWENNKRWIETKTDMKKIGIDVVFLPHTDGISSTDIRAKINNTIYKL
jgi:cytidyltransferase-related domain